MRRYSICTPEPEYVEVFRTLTSSSLSSDAGVLERRDSDGQDALLGSGHGRLAAAAGDSTAEVVPAGRRSGRDERDGSGHAHPQHAHHHVLLLPQPVRPQILSRALVHAVSELHSETT